LGFEAYAIAQSIADNGFFRSEPLLVIRSESHADTWIVVEGNRRLTALLGLTDKGVRSQFAEADKWEALAKRAKINSDTRIPVVLHKSRAESHVEVAKAHVLGKLQWRPYAQATFIAARIHEGRNYAEVAELIGITKGKVADLYRDQAIVTQAQELGLSTDQVEKAFSLLTVAMSSTKLRDHVGAPLGSRLEPNKAPIPAAKKAELKELIGWVFGIDDMEPKITDSRQISQLGNIVANEIGLKALREGSSLEEAKQKIAASGLPPRERLVQRLTTAKNALMAASDDLSDFASDPTIERLLDDAEAAMQALRSMINIAEDN
jgi:hypothetical protein